MIRKQVNWLIENMDRKHRRQMVLALGICVVSCVLLLVNPALSKRLIDDVIMAQNAEPLIPILLIMLAVKLLREGSRYGMIMMLESGSQNMLYNLRKRLYEKLMYNDMRFFDNNRTGDLMTRMSADLDWCRHFLAYIDYRIVDSVCTFAFAMIYLFTVDWKLTLILFVITPALLVISKMLRKRVRPRFVFMREKLSEMNTAAQENIAGIRVVKSFAREDYETDRFEERNAAFMRTRFRTFRRT